MDRAYLGFSFRWRPDRPEQGLVFDHEGRAHTGIFCTNHGQTPAYGVRFRGCLLVAPVEEAVVTAALEAATWTHPNIANPAGHPLYFTLRGLEAPTKIPSLHHLFAVGEVEYEDRSNFVGEHSDSVFSVNRHTRFCTMWSEPEVFSTAAPFLNDAT